VDPELDGCVPGSTESEDDWGGSLRFAIFKGVGVPQAMMVGAAGENSSQGAVTFIYGTTSGLTGTGSTSSTRTRRVCRARRRTATRSACSTLLSLVI
jgi:hypothetical protein